MYRATVRVGEYNQDTDPDCSNGICAPPYQEIEVSELIAHENYDVTKKKENDIALIRLKSAVQIGSNSSSPKIIQYIYQYFEIPCNNMIKFLLLQHTHHQCACHMEKNLKKFQQTPSLLAS